MEYDPPKGKGKDAHSKKWREIDVFLEKKNTGIWSHYEKPMTLKDVKSVIADMGADYSGTRIHIDRNEKLIDSGYYGYTDNKGKMCIFIWMLLKTEKH